MTDMIPDRAEAAAVSLRSEGIDAIGAALDVTSRAAVDLFVANVAERHRRLDILVNLAGVVRKAI